MSVVSCFFSNALARAFFQKSPTLKMDFLARYRSSLLRRTWPFTKNGNNERRGSTVVERWTIVFQWFEILGWCNDWKSSMDEIFCELGSFCSIFHSSSQSMETPIIDSRSNNESPIQSHIKLLTFTTMIVSCNLHCLSAFCYWMIENYLLALKKDEMATILTIWIIRPARATSVLRSW